MSIAFYVGEKDFGLRLPTTFSHEENCVKSRNIVHDAGKELIVGVNALMHQDMMDRNKPFLDFLGKIKTDYIAVLEMQGVFMWSTSGYSFKTIYDASTMATNTVVRLTLGPKSRCIRSCLSAVKSHLELFKMPEILEIPVQVSVYGASVIHHSKRPLLRNYYNHTD